MAYLYFLACCAVSIGLVSGLTYGLLGNTLTLNPDISAKPHEILWKHNGDKVIEFNSQGQRVFRQFQNRVTLDLVTAELAIINLGYEDTGEYVLETSKNLTLFSFSFEIKVMGEVPAPTIFCDMNNGSSGINGTQATLTCSAEPTKQDPIMEYEWVSDGKVFPGPKLNIILQDDHDGKIHTCRLSNPVSNKTTTFIARSCCSACFAKNDVEQQQPLRTTEVQQEEHSALLAKSPTTPASQKVSWPQDDKNVNPNLPANKHDEEMDKEPGEG